MSNTKEIFISHSVKDKEIIEAFVDIILTNGLSVQINQIFCVSTDGTKIKSGNDWRNSIKDALQSAKINFLIISSNYKESEVCMNEMGAAWMMDAKVIPLIIEPINYKTVGVIQEPNQIEKLLNEESLDRIKDIVQETLKIKQVLIRSDRWTAKKKEFLFKVKEYLSKHPFDTPINRVSFKELEKNNTELESSLTISYEEKMKLEKTIEELKKLKDKEKVDEVIVKLNPNSMDSEFGRIVLELSTQLLAFNPYVLGVIFCEYSGKSIVINRRDEHVEAIANDYITDELAVDWRTTKKMQNIYSLLKDLDEIISRVDITFQDKFKKRYENTPLKLGNKDFWNNVLNVSVYF